MNGGYQHLKSQDIILEEELSYNNSRSALLDPLDTLQGTTIPIGELEEAPQGRHMGVFSVMVMYISRILGSGIFATSSAVYESCGGSPFLYFLAWFFAYILAISGLYIYLELGSLIPRSGGTKVFLEVIYDKPFMLVSVIFLIYTVLFGFALLGALIFGEYFLDFLNIEVNEFRSRLTGFMFVLFACVFHSVSLKHGLFVQNFIGALKIVLLVIMTLTGLYVFLPSSFTGIERQLHSETFFEIKGDVSVASMTNAIIMASFTLAGWNLSHASSNEVKDPNRTYKIAGPLSLLIVICGYTAFNISYLWVLTDEEMVKSGNLVGAALFAKIFGSNFGSKFLTFSIAVCTGGNIFVVIYSISRMNQEVFREGFLPFSKFLASNQPFGTPMRSIGVSLVLTGFLLATVPEGNFYRYLVSVEGYPVQIYTLAVAVGIIILRKRYPGSRAPIKTHMVGVIITIVFSSYLLIAPFCSRNGGNPKGSESWVPYPIISLLVLLICIIYWLIKFVFFPWWNGYSLVPEAIELEDGLKVKQWNKVSARYFG